MCALLLKFSRCTMFWCTGVMFFTILEPWCSTPYASDWLRICFLSQDLTKVKTETTVLPTACPRTSTRIAETEKTLKWSSIRWKFAHAGWSHDCSPFSSIRQIWIKIVYRGSTLQGEILFAQFYSELLLVNAGQNLLKCRIVWSFWRITAAIDELVWFDSLCLRSLILMRLSLHRDSLVWILCMFHTGGH